MLSLILGLKITDAAVASITASFTNLELLDLSGFDSSTLVFFFSVHHRQMLTLVDCPV